MNPRFRSFLLNLAVFTVSVLLCYAFSEFVFLRFAAPQLPPFLRSNLPDLPDVTGQTSKRANLPHDYVAILGDSYAEGVGDWMLGLAQGNGEYSSAHVLHDLTGIDVISLGRWGAGSAEEMVLKPARVYLDRACFPLPKLEQPKRILVYFFEGNDLADNFNFVLRRIPSARNGDTPAVVARFLEDKFGKPEWWRCHSYFVQTVKEAARLLYRRYFGTAGDPANAIFPEGYEAANKVWSAGVAVPMAAIYPPIRSADDPDGTIAFIVFDEALAWLRKHFAQTPITIVYIPSPAAVYRYPSPVITVFRDKLKLTLEPAAKIYSDSQAICERIRALSLSHGASFIDTRPPIRAAARQALLHGPLDWIHFNESGYRLLGTILAQAGETPNTPCAPWDD